MVRAAKPCPKLIHCPQLLVVLGLQDGALCDVVGALVEAGHFTSFYCLAHSKNHALAHVARLPKLYLTRPGAYSLDELRALSDADREQYALPIIAIVFWLNAKGKARPPAWAVWLDERGVVALAATLGIPAEPPISWVRKDGVFDRLKRLAHSVAPALDQVVAMVDELRTALLSLQVRSKLEEMAAEVAVHRVQLSCQGTQLNCQGEQLAETQRRLADLEVHTAAFPGSQRRTGRTSEPSVLTMPEAEASRVPLSERDVNEMAAGATVHDVCEETAGAQPEAVGVGETEAQETCEVVDDDDDDDDECVEVSPPTPPPLPPPEDVDALPTPEPPTTPTAEELEAIAAAEAKAAEARLAKRADALRAHHGFFVARLDRCLDVQCKVDNYELTEWSLTEDEHSDLQYARAARTLATQLGVLCRQLQMQRTVIGLRDLGFGVRAKLALAMLQRAARQYVEPSARLARLRRRRAAVVEQRAAAAEQRVAAAEQRVAAAEQRAAELTEQLAMLTEHIGPVLGV